jgi:small subunit ribosomal protein S7
MSRRRQAVRRPIIKDAKFSSTLVSRLVNTVMERGKKSTAQRIVYGAFDQIAEKNPATNPLDILQRAVDNAKPRLEVKARRVGGATYQVPVEVRPERATSLAMRWLVQYARARAGRSMGEKLADELIDAANERGESVKKKEDTHRMADANKAFAHYRW